MMRTHSGSHISMPAGSIEAVELDDVVPSELPQQRR